jgi:hypothetical protein
MTRAAAKHPSQDRRAHEVQVEIYRNSIVAISRTLAPWTSPGTTSRSDDIDTDGSPLRTLDALDGAAHRPPAEEMIE